MAKNKVLSHPVAVRKNLIEPRDGEFSLRRQCGLLGLNRANWYYQPVGEKEETLRLMRLFDEQYTRTPDYGVLKMTAW